MNSSSSPGISMAVDLKKYRFRIHRGTLHVLGDPSCVQLMFDPDKKAILLMVPSKNAEFGQEEKVTFDHSGSDGSFLLYSKLLIQKIQLICPNLKDHNTYCLCGKYFPSKNAVFFQMSSLHRIDDNEAAKCHRVL